MLARTYTRCFIKTIGIILPRNFSNHKANDVMLPGGGLEKMQGGLKEEEYFRQHQMDLFEKIRQPGTVLKCEQCLGNWSEFEKVLDASSEMTALCETCSKSKHKNCNEEAFFLRQQNEEMKIFQDKLKMDDNDDNLKIATDNEKGEIQINEEDDFSN